MLDDEGRHLGDGQPQVEQTFLTRAPMSRRANSTAPGGVYTAMNSITRRSCSCIPAATGAAGNLEIPCCSTARRSRATNRQARKPHSAN